MRYLIHESQASEISGRCEYLYDIFHIYFLPRKSEGSYIPLIPVGNLDLDILFITGHVDQVDGFLQSNISNISEETIIATTCLPNKLKHYANKKKLYVPNIDGRFCYVRNGSIYGFSFNPSDAELNMYNSSGDIWKRISAGYRLLK